MLLLTIELKSSLVDILEDVDWVLLEIDRLSGDVLEWKVFDTMGFMNL